MQIFSKKVKNFARKFAHFYKNCYVCNKCYYINV